MGMMEPAFIEQIICALFPRSLEEEREDIDVADVPMFTLAELRMAASTLPSQKAPGPDEIPSEFVKAVQSAAITTDDDVCV